MKAGRVSEGTNPQFRSLMCYAVYTFFRKYFLLSLCDDRDEDTQEDGWRSAQGGYGSKSEDPEVIESEFP